MTRKQIQLDCVIQPFIMRNIHTLLMISLLMSFCVGTAYSAEKSGSEPTILARADTDTKRGTLDVVVDSTNEEEYYEFLVGLSFEDLFNLEINSASLFKTPLKKTVNQTRLYTRDMMDLYGVRSISDLLEAHQPGVNMGSHPGTGDLIGMRGVMLDNNSKTLVLYDGVNLNRRNHSGIFGADLRSPLTGDIEDVEVILGPGAIMHGSGAINGFINVRTHTGGTRPGLWAKTSFASGKTRTLEASVGGESEESHAFNYFTYAGYANADGVEPLSFYYEEGFKGFDNVIASSLYQDHARVNGLYQPNYKFVSRFGAGTEDSPFNFDLRVRFSQLSLGGGVPIQAPPSNLGNMQKAGQLGDGYTESTILALSPEITIDVTDKDNITLVGDLSAYRYRAKPRPWYFDAYKAQLPDSLQATADLPTYGHAEEHEGASLLYKTTRIPNNMLAVGTMFAGKQFSDNASKLWGTSNWDFGHAAPTNLEWLEFAVFTEDIMTFGSATFSLGARYDYTTFDTLTFQEKKLTIPTSSAASFRAACVYEITENHTVKLAYQDAYRFPDARYYTEVAYFNDIYNEWEPIPDLESEKSYLVEASYLGTFLNKYLALDVTTYYSHLRNTLLWVNWRQERPDDWAEIQNSPKSINWWGSFTNNQEPVNSFGSELGLILRLPVQGLESSVWYSFSRPFGEEVGKSILASWDRETWVNYPTHIIKGSIAYQSGNFHCGLTGHFRDGPTTRGSKDNPITEKDDLPAPLKRKAEPGGYVDANFGFKLPKGFSISFHGKNLNFSDVAPISNESSAMNLSTGAVVGATLEYTF